MRRTRGERQTWNREPDMPNLERRGCPCNRSTGGSEPDRSGVKLSNVPLGVGGPRRTIAARLLELVRMHAHSRSREVLRQCLRFTAVSVGLCLLGPPTALHAQARQLAATAVALNVAALDAMVDSAFRNGLSGHVLVGDATGKVLFERVGGLADRASLTTMTNTLSWRWASVSKQVTAALVFRQVEAGRLALDAPVATWLDPFVRDGRGDITLRQLLQHTSGLPDPELSPSDATGVPAFYRDAALWLSAPGVVPSSCVGVPRTPPGTQFVYNNCDFRVLQAVLERVTGIPYSSQVADLARALGLRGLTLVDSAATTGAGATHPIGYLSDGRVEPTFSLAAYGAAGALRAPARDLLAFDAALLQHRVVGAALTDTMFTGDPALGYVAFGAWGFSAPLVGCDAPVRFVERRGAIGGIEVRNILLPERGLIVIVFTNDANVPFGEIWTGQGFSHALLSAAVCARP